MHRALLQVLAGFVDSYFQRHPLSQDAARHLFTSASFTDLMGSCPELAQKLILMVTTELKPAKPAGMYQPAAYPGEQLQCRECHCQGMTQLSSSCSSWSDVTLAGA